GGRPGHAPAPPPAAALGRRAATRGDRARRRDRPRPAGRRRADRRSRRQIGGRDPHPPPRAEPRLREDRGHGDARPACRALRRRGRPSRQGRARERDGRRAVTYPRLVWKNLLRHPLRTVFTTLAIALSIFLVCAVLTLPGALDAVLGRASSNLRITVHHKAGLTYWLPFAFVQKVRSLPGVAGVGHYSWFGGIYDEPKNLFPNFAMDPDSVEQVWPDYGIDPAAVARFRKTRNGAVVGETTMRKFGCRIGQEVTLRGTLFPVDLTFQLVGVVPAASGHGVGFWFNRKYLEEAMEERGGMRNVGMIWMRAGRPEDVPGILHGVDARCRNP